MDRQQLIDEVKSEYQKRAEMTKQDSFIDQSGSAISNERYYELFLQETINLILDGHFDSFESGGDIVDYIANNKEKYLTKSELL